MADEDVAEARTRTEAKAERDVFLSKHRRGEIPAPTKVTVAECVDAYLRQLDGLVLAGEKAERTVQRYREHLTMHVVPEIGRIPIQKLTADHIAGPGAHLSERKGLAPWTIKGMLTPLGPVFSLWPSAAEP